MPFAVVTGAGGFVGRRLCTTLEAEGWRVVALTRQQGDLAECDPSMLLEACRGADIVYHLAGRAHRPDGGRDEAARHAYRRDNVSAALRVHDAARRAGAATFVYMSSIKALADVSARPLAPDDEPCPQDVYAESKLEAERSLAARSQELPVVIVRPPLVYGPGVRGNMASLIEWVDRGLPLPLGAAHAERSLVALDNLTALLGRIAECRPSTCVLHVRDDEDLTARRLVERIAASLGRNARLLPVPASAMKLASTVLGRRATYARLFEPLRVDDTATRRLLDWSPPVTSERAIAEMGAWWRKR